MSYDLTTFVGGHVAVRVAEMIPPVSPKMSTNTAHRNGGGGSGNKEPPAEGDSTRGTLRRLYAWKLCRFLATSYSKSQVFVNSDERVGMAIHLAAYLLVRDRGMLGMVYPAATPLLLFPAISSHPSMMPRTARLIGSGAFAMNVAKRLMSSSS